MSEAMRFMKILNENNAVRFFDETSKNYLELFSQRMHTMSIAHFDKPDIVIGDEKFIYFFEHFEFDSSLNTKKGTKMRKEEAKVNREFDRFVEEKMKTTTSDEPIYKRDTYKTNRSIENYVKNFKRNFLNHYQKIDEYRENAKVHALKQDYEFGFVIENKSNMPDVVLDDDGKTALLLPIHIPELKQLLSDSADIKNIFYITENGNSGYTIFYFRINECLLNELEGLNIQDYSEKELFNWNAHSYGVVVPIPKE